MEPSSDSDIDSERGHVLASIPSNSTNSVRFDPQLGTPADMSPKVNAKRSIVSRSMTAIAGIFTTEPSSDSEASARKRTLEATTFDSNSSSAMLRATTLASILRNFGAILRDSTGTEETYGLSHPVVTIDIFLSHNWAVTRRTKFAALILEFNVLPSIGIAFACALGGCALNWLGAAPTLTCSSATGGAYNVGISCQLLGMLGFFSALALWREGFWGRSEQSQVFLDKVCIHQTDPDLKAAAIRKLGAFLGKSQRMLVLYSPLYCRKLWTIYELACFLCMQQKDPDCLRVLPVKLAVVVISVLAFDGVGFLSYSLLCHFVGDGSRLRLLVLVLLVLVTKVYVSKYVRAWARDLEEAKTDLNSFSFAQAQCFDPADREFVGRNICDFMKARRLADSSDNQEETIQKFEKLVKSTMPDIITSAAGSGGFPYHLALLLGLPVDFFFLDIISAHQPSGKDWRFYMSWLTMALFLHVVAMPSTVRVQMWAGKVLPRSENKENKFGEGLAIAAISVLGAIVFFMAYMVASFSKNRALHSSVWAVGFFAATPVLWLCVAALYGCLSERSRRGGAAFAYQTLSVRSLSSNLTPILSSSLSLRRFGTSSSVPSTSLHAESIGKSSHVTD